MKKFKFTLERVHGYKQTVLDKEKLALSNLRIQLAEIEAEIENLLLQIDLLHSEKTQKAANGTTMFELKKLDYQLDASRNILKELYIKQELKNIEIQRQLDIVMHAKSEVQGLEKLSEKQKEAYNYEVAKQTAEEIGEMISEKMVRESIAEGY